MRGECTQHRSAGVATAGVGLSEFLESTPDGCVGHPLEVEWRVESSQHVFFQTSESVAVFIRHGDHLEVCVHPSRQGRFVDCWFTAAVGQDRSEGAPEGGELVAAAQMHACDPRPECVGGRPAAWPAGRSRQSGVDEAGLQRQAKPSREAVGTILISPPAVEPRDPEVCLAPRQESRWGYCGIAGAELLAESLGCVMRWNTQVGRGCNRYITRGGRILHTRPAVVPP